MLIPWYLIPGRPYPIQVYLHACCLYSKKPEIGQRGAAKATRERFKLGTFSHSTVSRSFRSLEQAHKAALEKRYGEEINIRGGEDLNVVSAAAKSNTKSFAGPRPERRFPTVAATAKRRGAMRGFFADYPGGAKRTGVETGISQFVEGWHKRTLRMLL